MWVLWSKAIQNNKGAGAGEGDEREQDGSSYPPFIPARALGPGAPDWTAISIPQAFTSNREIDSNIPHRPAGAVTLL